MNPVYIWVVRGLCKGRLFPFEEFVIKKGSIVAACIIMQYNKPSNKFPSDMATLYWYTLTGVPITFPPNSVMSLVNPISYMLLHSQKTFCESGIHLWQYFTAAVLSEHNHIISDTGRDQYFRFHSLNAAS